MTEGAGSSPRRVARPQDRYMPSTKENADAWSRLLAKIDACYAEARGRLAGSPATLARFLSAGVCIGLLDPVSNIMANTICVVSDRWPDLGAAAAADEDPVEMGRRSLRGLIAFLIYFFPYLAEWEAVRYLLLAGADLLAAARLIVADRGMAAGFSINSDASVPAFEAALALAAQVAKHPQPKHLLHVWMSLSSRPHQALSLLSELQPDSPLQNLEPLQTMPDDPVVPNLAISWDLAASRPAYSNSIANMPYEHTRSLRMVLLDTIHGFYLRALAMLPRGELRSQLHRSLLRAGCCYGPMDPVSNIINNTTWYHANFPAAKTPVLDVIGPDSLTRLESRSFYGLVSFLQTRHHDLSDHQAVQCLVAAHGHLSRTDPEMEREHHHRQCSGCQHVLHPIGSFYDDVIRKVGQQSPCAGIQEAYVAAATAAWHPNPEEQAAFLTSGKVHPVEDQLTSEDVNRLCCSLSPKQPPIPELICKSSYTVKAGKMRSEAQQRRVSRKVKAALGKHLLQDGVG